MQYKYLDSDAVYLPLKPQDYDHVPSAMETSAMKFDYFQSIGGPEAYASLCKGGICSFKGLYYKLYFTFVASIYC